MSARPMLGGSERPQPRRISPWDNRSCGWVAIDSTWCSARWEIDRRVRRDRLPARRAGGDARGNCLDRGHATPLRQGRVGDARTGRRQDDFRVLLRAPVAHVVDADADTAEPAACRGDHRGDLVRMSAFATDRSAVPAAGAAIEHRIGLRLACQRLPRDALVARTVVARRQKGRRRVAASDRLLLRRRRRTPDRRPASCRRDAGRRPSCLVHRRASVSRAGA